MTAVAVSRPVFEHHREARGVREVRPRLSWMVEAPAGWVQAAYEVGISGIGQGERVVQVDGADQVLVPWPFADLGSRDRRAVRVRVVGADGRASDWSPPAVIEAGLLSPSDWSARAIAAAWSEDTSLDNPPPRMRREFQIEGDVAAARLQLTAHGLAELEINGLRVGDQALLPGWTVYQSRLRVATFDVTALLDQGGNAIGAWLGDGWFRGVLGFEGGTRNIYGDRLALLAQLDIEYRDGREQRVVTDEGWAAAVGPILSSGLYAGERYDARREQHGWSKPGFDASGWTPVETVPLDLSVLTGYDGPPVRSTQEVRVQSVTELSGGRLLLDFGQNLVGRLGITPTGPAGSTIRLLHAEVLEDGELSRRPLRGADARDEFTLAGTGVQEPWEPRFTIHGFRYAEVEGWVGGPVSENVVARVYHSDLERTGWFACSSDDLTRLHENVVWSMRGNFVDLPTDCPQRDERLGWTGDIQVFAPTASFLYDCSGFLASWLKDLAAEQLPGGEVPWYVPVIPGGEMWTPIRPAAVWGDAAVLTPWTIWERFGDRGLLERQWDSAQRWVDLVARLSGPDHLWNEGFQLGDWLDPAAPPDDPAAARTDPALVATAYAAHSTRRLADMAAVLGRTDDEARYRSLARQIRAAFGARHLLDDGRLTSDAPTAYALAIAFDLLDQPALSAAGDRLAALVRAEGNRIATGFAGTNVVMDALSRTGHVDTAFDLLLQDDCPSWLYAVRQGATTIWERWDSMLPDGTVNPGEMTSFNHYALGAVADWMHRVVAGLGPLSPGYRRIAFRPLPHAGLSWAEARHTSPYGAVVCRWERDGAGLTLFAQVPPGSTGVIELPGCPPVEIGSGSFRAHQPTGATRINVRTGTTMTAWEQPQLEG